MGAVAEAADDILKCKDELTFGWDIDKYRDKEKKDSAAALTVDSAVTDVGWWFAMEALSALQFVVQDMQQWSKGRPCHTNWVSSGLPADVRRRWERCPLRTMRLP